MKVRINVLLAQYNSWLVENKINITTSNNKKIQSLNGNHKRHYYQSYQHLYRQKTHIVTDLLGTFLN